MLSGLFRKDYKAMTAQGVVFTPEDIVRLNALAVRVGLSQKPVSAVNLQRAVFMPCGIVLREPTIGHEMWLEEVGRFMDYHETRVFEAVHFFALSRQWDDLPSTDDPKGIVRKVFAFARRKMLPYTHDQLTAALDYALFGADWTAGEIPPPPDPPKDDEPRPAAASSPALGVFIRAKAEKIGLTLDEARQLTASQIVAMTTRAMVNRKGYDFDFERASAMKDYVRTREEIRARGGAAHVGG